MHYQTVHSAHLEADCLGICFILLEMAVPAPSSGGMIQISVSYSWHIYQHYSNVTAPTSCYLTVGPVPRDLCLTSITLGIVLGWSAAGDCYLCTL